MNATEHASPGGTTHPPATAATATGPETAPGVAPEGIRILLLEDSSAYARLIKEYFAEDEEVPFKIIHAETLVEGLKILETDSIQVVLLDLSVPDSQGLDTFTQVFEKKPQVPIVVLSGNDDRTLAMNAVQRGAQDYLVKGKINGDVLPRVVRYAIGRKKVEEALRRSEEQLLQAQRMEGIGRLAGGIAHDFNNLLTSILGFGQMVARDLGPDSPARDDVMEIIHAGERAAALTQQLLAFGRKQILCVRRVDLNEVVSGMFNLLRRTLGEDIQVSTELSDDLGCIQADVGQLEQVLLNLAVNARDAMPRGGRLVIRTRRALLDEAFCRSRIGLAPGEYSRLTVRDTGCGMTPEIQKYIFEPFFTTKERGSGLGLSTAYGIIKQSSGWIEVESEAGRGSVFRIYLPRCAGLPETIVPADGGRAARGTETVLLVEDEPTLRTLASRILRRLGYKVLEANTGPIALDVALGHSGPLHLVLTDVVMPEMSGPELVEELSARRRDFKVLYMTGFADDTIFQHGVSERQANLILKPYTRDSLASKVRTVLDG